MPNPMRNVIQVISQPGIKYLSGFLFFFFAADQMSPGSFNQIRNIRFEGMVMFKVSMSLVSIILKESGDR